LIHNIAKIEVPVTMCVNFLKIVRGLSQILTDYLGIVPKIRINPRKSADLLFLSKRVWFLSPHESAILRATPCLTPCPQW